MDIDIVVGGQFGSEAKGHVAAILAAGYDRQSDLCIRVGGPNAGHTVIDRTGKAFAFRHVPVAAVISDMRLYIGPGSEVNVDVLDEEIRWCRDAGYDLDGRLFVDSQATILTASHIAEESEMRGRIGSTAKGIGACRADRIWRSAELVQDHISLLEDIGCEVVLGVPEADRVVIEGTQGYGLGLHAGFYPTCTSGDCRNIDFLAQSGLAWPAVYPKTWVVFRTYPIRVAGNSGPLYKELSWDELSSRTDGFIRPEKTTVTKLVRRIGEWDAVLAENAVLANGGPLEDRVNPVLTFVDYLDPGLAGCTSFEQLRDSSAWQRIAEMEDDIGARFVLFTTGPNTHIWRHGR